MISMKHVCLLLSLGALFLSANTVSLAAQPGQKEQAPNEQMQKEVDEIASRFLESLQASGNLRKVDPKLLHPLFLNPPCALIPEVDRTICLKLSPDDRREYTLVVCNSAWLYINILMSGPPLSDQEVKKFQTSRNIHDLTDSLVPSELHPLFGKIGKQEGLGKSIDEFKARYSALMEAEKTLLAVYAKINDAGKRRIQWQYDLADSMNVLRYGDKLRMKSAHIEELPDAFEYENNMFRFVVAKDRGVFKVIQFSLVSD
jgi:hypothetical protein